MEKEERYLLKQIVKTFSGVLCVVLFFGLPYLFPHILFLGKELDFNGDGKVSWSELFYGER